MDDDLTIRPMTEADRPGMRESTRAAFDDLLQRLGTPAEPDGTPTASTSTSGAAIVGQLLELDAAGAWVATVGGQVCGAAMAGLREGLWYLAHLHVRPGRQGRGVGRRLLDAALRHGPDARGRLLHASLDPRAMRCYQRAGFALEPAMQAIGVVRRAALPATGRVRAGDAEDLDLAAEVDRRVRGAAHGPDLDVLLRAGARLLVLDDRQERGYALIDAGTPKMLAATSATAAVTLLWAALAESGEHALTVEILRADQQWAIDVAHRAGLGLAPMGPLCRQGDTGPLAPYLPHADIL
jgi:ribosomal protein S18 acetylase RimI-like enzyme